VTDQNSLKLPFLANFLFIRKHNWPARARVHFWVSSSVHASTVPGWFVYKYDDGADDFNDSDRVETGVSKERLSSELETRRVCEWPCLRTRNSRSSLPSALRLQRYMYKMLNCTSYSSLITNASLYCYVSVSLVKITIIIIIFPLIIIDKPQWHQYYHSIDCHAGQRQVHIGYIYIALFKVQC